VDAFPKVFATFLFLFELTVALIEDIHVALTVKSLLQGWAVLESLEVGFKPGFLQEVAYRFLQC